MQKSLVKHAILLCFSALAIGFVLGINEREAYGAECTPIYGGGEVCPKVAIAFIDKAVFNPFTDRFVDNMTESDMRFSPQDIVTFRLIIKNTGEVTINSVTIKDTFPNFVNFLSGIGKHENGLVTIDVGDLGPGETREFILRGQVVPENQLPDRNLICPVINHAEMRGEVDAEIVVSDTSQLCIEKKVLGVEAKALPAAGAGSLLLLTSSLTTAGIFLRKFS